MTKKEVVILSSNNAHNRIPNFKGSAEATQRLSELEEFKQAKVIKISPDKPQESVKKLALENNKEILVPNPRLKSGLFNLISRVTDPTEEELKNIVTRHGIQQIEKPIGLDSNVKVSILTSIYSVLLFMILLLCKIFLNLSSKFKGNFIFI